MGLVVLGLLLGSAAYRRYGLAVFALAVVKVYVFDMSGLLPIYRIIAFTALGAALLTISFVYSRYAEQIKRWL